MKEKQYVIGLDFGTDSVRALIVDAATGAEAASAVSAYSRWRKGLFCDPAENRFRQHPLDYLESLEACVKTALKQAGACVRERVAAISVDTTGSTPCAVDRTGTPLALRPGFEKNPNAMFVLWKDHTAVEEAAEINHKAKSFGTMDYTKYVGGVYSSEWFWAKMMHVFRRDPAVRHAAHSFMEHCDWVPAVLAGVTRAADVKRSRCAAGHKALWHGSFNGLPPESFLTGLDPALKGMRQRLYDKTYPADTPMGGLSAEWAGRLGLRPGITVGTGAFDAHMGAVGAGITPYALCKIIGTSTCDILIAPLKEMGDRVVQGICGQVDGSVIPGMLGMEAGQSAFGDLFAWFKNVLAWSGRDENAIERLSKEAAKIGDTDTAVTALDWINGRRTPNANQMLKGAITGLTLGTTAPAIFKGLVESAAFGARRINEQFITQGVPIRSVIALGGVAKKSPYIMQTLADILNMPIQIVRSEQACALGAAMCGAAAAGLYPDVPAAQERMQGGYERTYRPDAGRAKALNARYEQYLRLGAFAENEVPAVRSRTKPRGRAFSALREEAWQANQDLVKHGLIQYTFGNVSAFDPEKGVFAIKPSGVPYETLSLDDMVVVDLDGKVAEGTLRPSSDTPTHLVLYRHFPGIRGIAHTHSTYATTWAQARRPVPVLGTTHADLAPVGIPCTGELNVRRINGDYEKETGMAIVRALRHLSYHDVEMALVAGHGPFTWGDSAAKAVYNSVMLEELARMALFTRQINPRAPLLGRALIRKHYQRKHGKNAYYGQKI